MSIDLSTMSHKQLEQHLEDVKMAIKNAYDRQGPPAQLVPRPDRERHRSGNVGTVDRTDMRTACGYCVASAHPLGFGNIKSIP